LIGTEGDASEVRLQRRARVLLGWLDTQQAGLMLTSRRADVELSDEQQTLVVEARAAVANRDPNLDQVDLVRPLPDELSAYVEEMHRHPATQAYFAEGWDVALADLSRAIAVQPHVFVDHAAERVTGVDVDDMEQVAGVTLPLAPPATLTPQFDQQRQAFILASANPNLRVTGPFGSAAGPEAPGAALLGFSVSVLSSFVQVAEMQGRYYLRDGYHRSLGLLQAGATYAPVFVRHGLTVAELLPAGLAGMLPYEAFAGERPPTLPDYWADIVSCDAQLPAAQKIILIQALETLISG
jgi:hypothetical protein